MALGLALTSAFAVTVTGSTAASAATTTTVVDTFATGVNIVTSGAGTADTSSSGPTATLLGGARRTAFTTTAGGGGRLSTGSLDGVADLALSTSGGSAGTASLTYDGSSSAGAVNPTGLGAVDLTDGGTHNGLAAAAGTSLAGVNGSLTLYTDANDCSTVTVGVPVAANPGAGSQDVFWRFADLTTAAGCSGPADPTKVGAVVITIDASAAAGATVVLRDVRSAIADYGDLPTAWGVTTAAEGGAAAIIDPSLSLGTLLAGKADGVHSPDSSADPDDDGVTPSPGVTWAAGSPTDSPAAGGALSVTVTGTGCLSIWLGLAPGTDLSVAGDEVVTRQPVTSGTTTERFALPAGFTLPASVVGRVRLFPRDLDGTCTAEEPLGGVSDGGEVEDYVFSITPAPVAPTFVSLPPSPSASRAPTWTFTQQPGTTETCQLTDAAGTVISAAAACTGSFTARLPQKDGVYTLTVVATDGQGRVSPTATTSYQLDTTPPANPVITASPVSPSNADQPAWQFTSPKTASAECQLSYGSTAPMTVVQDFAGCVSPQAVNLTGRPDGTYTFSVEALDAAGNISAVATSTLVRDTTPPTLPVFTKTPPAVASSLSPSWSFSIDPSANAQCQVTGLTPAMAFTACASPYVASLNGQPDGSYTLNVRSLDAAGNLSATASATTTLDTTPPDAVILSAPASPISSSSLTWTFTAGDPSATLTCSLSSAGKIVSAAATCAGTDTFSVTGRPDGDYQLTVQATDAAGNVGPAVTSDVVVDRTAPAVPTVTTPATPTRDPQVAWSFTADPTALVYCSLAGPDATSTPVACASPDSFDLSRRPDGSYTFSAYAEDQAGNQSAAATSTITLDRSPPGLGITSSPVSPSQNRKPTWAFATDPGTTSECRLDLGTTNVFPFGPCSSPFTVDLTGDPDGAYVFSVRSLDAAGNVAGPVQSTYLLDTTPPVSPTILSSPQSPSNSRSPSWTFSSEASSAQTCRLLSGSADAAGNGAVLLDWQSCAGTFTAQLAKTPDGLITFEVRATDAAGNTSAPATASYLLDTTAGTPKITSAPPSPGRATEVSWGFSLDPDESAECRLVGAGKTAGAFTACASPVAEDLSGLGDGEVDLQVQATDLADNTSAIVVSSYVLDTTPPASPVFTGSPVTPGSTRAPTWSFTGPTDGVTSCRATQGTVALTSWLPCAGTASADLTGLVDGSYAVQVRATDNAGNVSPAVTSPTYVLITQPPVAPTIVVAPGPGGPAQTVSWQVAAPAGNLIECRLTDDALVVSPFTACSGAVTYTVTGVPDGTLLFSARAVDAVGSIGPTAASAFVLDRTPPGSPIVTEDQGKTGVNGVVSWSFTADPGAATECEVTKTGGEVVISWRLCTGSFALDLTPSGSGAYQFFVRASDTWGNVSVPTQSDYGYDAPVLPPQTQIVGANTPGVTAAEKAIFAPVKFVLAPVTENLGPKAATRAPGVKPVVRPYQARPPPASLPEPKTPPAVAIRPLPDSPFTPGRVFQAIVSGARDHVALPLVLIVALLLFLAVQDRLDRGDPKLALAPGAGGNDYAEFR